jgi:hypothetical protein
MSSFCEHDWECDPQGHWDGYPVSKVCKLCGAQIRSTVGTCVCASPAHHTCREALSIVVSTAEDIIKQKEQTGEYSLERLINFVEQVCIWNLDELKD